jgi:hypothetical protein
MNCGLADNTNGAPIKKAFFNQMVMDWAGEDAQKMIEYLISVNTIRKELDDSLDVTEFEMLNLEGDAIGFKYGDDVMVFFNTDMDTQVKLHVPASVLKDYKVAATSFKTPAVTEDSQDIQLDEGGALLLCKR